MSVYAWTTWHELDYLDNLGRRNDPDLAIKENRKTLLERYLEGAKQRANWHPINKKTVLNYVEQHLKSKLY